MCDVKAHSMITKHLSDLILLTYIMDPQTSKQLFDLIIAQFKQVNTGVEAFYTFMDMMSLHWDGESPLTDHVAKL